MMRATIRALSVFVVLAFLVGGAGLAFLKLDAFDAARARVAAELASSELRVPVTVAGPVGISLGRSVTISVQGVRSAADIGKHPATGLRLILSPTDLIRGRFRPEALELSGLNLRFGASAEVENGPSLGPRIAGAVASFLSAPLAADLTVDDAQIVWDGDPDGWDFRVAITRLTSRVTVDGRALDLAADGTLNGVPFSLSGRAPRLGHDGADGPVALDWRIRGLDAALTGRLMQAPDGPAFDGRLAATSTALDALLETLDLAPGLKGTARTELGLVGPLAALSTTTATLGAATEAGHELKAKGRLADLWAGRGLDLDFDLSIARPAAGWTGSSLAPRHVSGRLLGDATQLEIADLTVDLDHANLYLARVGPISVARIARDGEGRVRLEGVRLLQGDPADPMIDLSGTLEDLLGLSGITASGKFALALAPLFGFPAPVDLGVLRGSVGLSDATGSLVVETLDAVTGSGAPATLAVRREAPSQETAVELAIADLDVLASAIGREHRFAEGAGVGFEGRIGVATGTLRIAGVLEVGATTLDGQLSIGVGDGVPVATGTLHTRILYPEDLALAADAASMLSGLGSGAVRLDPNAASGARLTMDVMAGAVAGSTGGASDVTAHLELSKTALRIDPFGLHYFGGRIDGALAAQFSEAPPPLDIEARIRAVDLAAIFGAFGRPAAVTGPLDMDLAVRGAGRTPAAFFASLSGSVAASIYDGRLSNSAVNLAGQSISSWVFEGGPNAGAALVCLVSAVDFQSGIGTVQELVAETEKVQFIGAGKLDLGTRSLDLTLTPRPKRQDPLGTVGPVVVRGPFDEPTISLAMGSVAGKVAGDALGLPFRAIGRVFRGGGPSAPDRRPCVVAHGPDRAE